VSDTGVTGGDGGMVIELPTVTWRMSETEMVASVAISRARLLERGRVEKTA
jgi:hypothetical protein